MRACDGDRAAARALFERMAPTVLAWIGQHRLDAATAQDIAQVVWMRLYENCETIRDPRRIAGWLRVTTRNECNAEHRRRRREVPLDAVGDVADDGAGQDEVVEAIADRRLHAQVLDAFRSLDARCRQLLGLLVEVPVRPYAEIAEALGMPIGSLGPTRARCLEKLRRQLAMESVNG